MNISNGLLTIAATAVKAVTRDGLKIPITDYALRVTDFRRLG